MPDREVEVAVSRLVLEARGRALELVPGEWVDQGLHPDALYSSILQAAVAVGVDCGIAAAFERMQDVPVIAEAIKESREVPPSRLQPPKRRQPDGRGRTLRRRT